MILSEDQVKEIAKSKVDEWIKEARKDHDLLRMHYYGTRSILEEWLTKVDGLENEAELELRRRYAISNKFLTQNLIRPTDNIWQAKGGTEKIDIKSETVLEKYKKKLKNVRHQFSLRQYSKNVWFENFITDPCGLCFVDVNDKGESYLTQKSIASIKNMKFNGVIPEYVCFEPDTFTESEKEKSQYLWVVDDASYYRVRVGSNGADIANTLPNSFGQVPGFLNSPIYDTERKFNISPIWGQIELLGKYLLNGSVKEIYIAKHGYPIFWTYAQKCDDCNGEGWNGQERCGTCGGSGQTKRKDVSQAITLRHPEKAEDPQIAPNIAGYVQPDIATWQEQRDEQDWTWNLIYYSHWGTYEASKEKGGDTATGRFIDSQAITHRLNEYADIIESNENRVANLIGKAEIDSSFNGYNMTIGRRFMVESVDQLWDKYLKAKKEKAPTTTLDHHLEQYYESEFQRDKFQLDYHLKLMKLEPFVHMTLGEVLALPISDQEKAKKLYFNEWLSEKMMNEIVDKKLTQLTKDLDKYVQSKQLNNGTEGSSKEGD